MHHQRPISPEPALGIAGAVLLPATFVFMILEVEPFVSHAYEIAWWSLIAALDGLVWWRTRRSPLAESPLRFLLLALWSVAFWYVFELFNLRLRNWHYIYVGNGAAERWRGGYLAFSTVLPAIVLLAEGLSALGLSARAPATGRRRSLPAWLPSALAAVGLAFLVLPVLWPRYFYPLVWGGVVLVLDPLNRRLGAPSFLGEWEERTARPLLLYLLAGAASGLLWEGLNYWARVKWIYTVPFFEELKLFEMPFLGFVGFLPFALDCRAAVETLGALGLVPPPGARLRPARALLLVFVALLASAGLTAISLPAMDRLTFASVYPRIADLPGVSREDLIAMQERGIDDVFQLRKDLTRRGEGGSPLARRADLILLAGIGAEKALALWSLGIGGVEDLAVADPGDLWSRLARFDLRHRPTPAEVRLWVRRARKKVALP